ncbi:MAG TPA: D-glycero-beta-D-manno-heptose 1,7-bisphosphate 7-phosphatase [Thermodesulfatator atlanticus]|uniref:D,D-heptose 1,7-bisphosphate phosphatase n=1 Tax=Thermodesulfatator atlanticus TaxID=501497 RepID=A0A7V5NZJ7_9BACT|nr:D-glycero-beta-D-manno-heptose 1,7-bisphosphate 7-phosphatase [Thermodesulfatator atlanticus]
MKRPVVFLDRDGTINEEVGYLNHLSRFRLLPRAAEGIRLLKEAGFAVVVITNQSGIARGFFPKTLVEEVHALMQELLAREGATLDGIYYCPHHPDEGCYCRKPRPGLVERAAQELGLDLCRAYVVGDRFTDLQLAKNINAKGVLVLTGYGRGEHLYYLPRLGLKPDLVAEDLFEAAQKIISHENLNR